MNNDLEFYAGLAVALILGLALMSLAVAGAV